MHGHMGIGSSIDDRFGAPARNLSPIDIVAPAGIVRAAWSPVQQVGRNPGPMPLVFSLASATRPAGAVTLTDGAPLTTYQPGTWNFRASLLAIYFQPNINRAAFPANLNRTVGEVISRGTTNIAATTVSVGDRTLVNLSPGLTSIDRQRPGVWVTVTGTITNPDTMTLDQVHRAVARALAQSMTWAAMPATPPAGMRAPADGSQLHELLNNGGLTGGSACTGGYKDGQVWARGCIRLVPGTASASTPAPAPAVAPAPTAPAPSTGAPRPAAPAPTAAQGCVVAPRDYFYLRPTATFAATGSRFAARTPIALLGRTDLTQRGASGAELRLYRVRIASGSSAGQEGFAALSAADLQPATAGSCPTSSAVPSYAISPATGGGGASVPAPAPRPASPSSPSPAQPVLQQLRGPASATSAAWYLGGATLLSAVIGGVLWWKREDLGLVAPKNPSARRSNSVPATRIYQ